MESKYSSETWAAEAKESKTNGDGLGAKSGAKSNSRTIVHNDFDEEDLEADAEWELLKRKKRQGEIRVSSNPAAQRILRGFRINHMRMRDAESGRLMWRSEEWGDDMFEREMEAHVPASILDCRAVAREINFTSEEAMNKFRLEQRVYFQGVCMEEWFFNFGFVIPGSTNTWEQTIYAAEKSAMLPAHLISGQITIETSFYDDNLFVSKSLVRIFYDLPEPTIVN
ncbi:Retinal rod rhodopsin-sensitive cGMP 3',5'-cyclic phosphodiesterase subunit delta [Hondaea fermentalgiana]|uniref:Retinal rod rhodopsin-sensitive cGMP 3',5'-cyclic phosphodiesterase subunit delta n=1 Tax=Hondaea fermentalgiana TaxID=2315210 RepID=A0A2R5GDW4_9STRA|nr:Retinal rod rhodopsin-sensitive cGMP 3',5'-cyclic phosphodiesterase subunit delta [Hondaea fermentalgiana]|eukprot:GBG26401.1 Retinal rod rhodopsin-sensitive cGMP 3',5'-cyclic phosphodiesterase subunit delta [Hondaea fermentalgiana]